MSSCGCYHGGATFKRCMRAFVGADVVFGQRVGEDCCGHDYHLVARRGEVYEQLGVSAAMFKRLMARHLTLISPYTLTHHHGFVLRCADVGGPL